MANLSHSSKARYWWLRLAIFLLSLSPFLVAEALVRALIPKRKSDIADPFLDCSRLTPLFERDGEVYRTSSLRNRLFEPTQFLATKNKKTKRIFCIGGSTTQGEPYKPPTAFPAWLQINLQLADPGHDWEVVNCGGLSYASYRLLPILIEVLAYQPDLIVIDCGHNEFLEARELSGWKSATVLEQSVIDLARYSRLIDVLASNSRSHLSTPRVGSSATQLQQEVDALLDDRGGLERYKRDDLNSDSVIKSMKWNLAAMIRHCEAAAVPVTLLVPTANLRDCPPFKFELSRNLDDKMASQIEGHWTKAMDEQKHCGEGHPQSHEPKAMRIRQELEQILTIDSEHANAHYWMGHLELANQQLESARNHFIAARDHDICPLRATSAVQHTIRQLADEKKVWCLDIDVLFQSVSSHQLVGNQWLIDHVHPRIEGHQMLADQLTDLLIQKNFLTPTENDWKDRRVVTYREHLKNFGEDYFLRGKQRLAGLTLWTQGRTRKGVSSIPLEQESQ